MKRLIPFLLMLALSVSVVWALDVGSDHEAAGTSNYTVSFGNSVGNIAVAPTTEDIQVVLRPNNAGASDTMTVRGGDVMNWTGLPSIFTGVDIIRTSSTAVDVYWW